MALNRPSDKVQCNRGSNSNSAFDLIEPDTSKRASLGEKVRKIFVDTCPKPVRFLICSVGATSCDFALYMICVQFLIPSISQVISYSCGVVVNFILQKIYVFENQTRKTRNVFIFSIPLAALGIVMSSILIHYLTTIEFFMEYQFITKTIVSILVFFYNYFTRKFLFEGSLSRYVTHSESSPSTTRD